MTDNKSKSKDHNRLGTLQIPEITSIGIDLTTVPKGDSPLFLLIHHLAGFANLCPLFKYITSCSQSIVLL